MLAMLLAEQLIKQGMHLVVMQKLMQLSRLNIAQLALPMAYQHKHAKRLLLELKSGAALERDQGVIVIQIMAEAEQPDTDKSQLVICELPDVFI
jgi:hypothetical protein